MEPIPRRAPPLLPLLPTRPRWAGVLIIQRRPRRTLFQITRFPRGSSAATPQLLSRRLLGQRLSRFTATPAGSSCTPSYRLGLPPPATSIAHRLVADAC